MTDCPVCAAYSRANLSREAEDELCKKCGEDPVWSFPCSACRRPIPMEAEFWYCPNCQSAQANPRPFRPQHLLRAVFAIGTGLFIVGLLVLLLWLIRSAKG